MKKLMFGAALVALASGCVGIGGATSSVCSVVTLDVQSSAGFVDNSVKPLKSGSATSSGIICIADGDASIKAAMENGGIKKVHHIDYKTRNILGIIGSTTTTVWGE